MDNFRGKRVRLFQCPLCTRWQRRKPKQRTPRSVAHYRVYHVGFRWLMFRCDRCRRVFKTRFGGEIHEKGNKKVRIPKERGLEGHREG